MDFLSVDFETRSQCDLFKEGVYRYATDTTTEILMMGWAFNDEPAVVWTPEHPFPKRVIDHVKAGGEIRAWNAQFERLIWWYVLASDFGVPEPELEQFRCTAARARAHGLPGSLKDAARSLALPMQKQDAGQRLIKLYCVPGHKDLIPAEDWALFIDYCRMDVEVERQLTQFLRELNDTEWEDYWVNERINDRGVPVDVPFAIAAQAYGVDIKADADRRIAELTNGEVANARARSDRNQWLSTRLSEKHREVLIENKVMKFGKPRREELLLQPDLDADVREFTELVEEAGGATLGKYQAFSDRALDGRLRGAFMFSGGGQTGRYCVAENQTIFVLRSEVVVNLPIQELLLTDLVWDGQAFVEHGGLVFSGYKEVIEYDGVTATPDHHVFTQTHGKITLAEASQRGYALEVSGCPSADKIQRGRPLVSDESHETLSRYVAMYMRRR